jgi:hypothetical protein
MVTEAHEVDLEEGDPVEVEIIDDTPIEDQGRKPLNKDALAEDDEAAKYAKDVKRRLGELRHQAHDERRAKETAFRERDEAIRVAQEALRTKKERERQLTFGESSFAHEAVQRQQLAVASAKEKHRKAYEAGDPDAMAEAVAELASASQAFDNANRWSAGAKQKAENFASQQAKDAVDSQQQSRQTQAAPVANQPVKDPRAEAWVSENSEWFGPNPDMTSLAFGVHERLVKEGVHPVEDADQYYAALNAEMRKRFPEYEWDGEAGEGKKPDTKQKTATKKPTVAPVTRVTSGAKNKVVLTQTQVRMAEKFGLTLEQYARELQKLGG